MALISYWPMNEGTGTILHDTYGSNTLTQLGTEPTLTWATGHGSNSYAMNCNTSYMASQAVTIPLGTGNTVAWWSYITNPAQYTGQNTGVFFMCNGQSFYIGSNTSDYWLQYQQNPSGASLPNRWQHCAITIDSSGNYQYYINGIAANSGTTVSDWGNQITSLQIGWWDSDVNGFHHPGYANDLYYWNSIASLEDITKAMNGTLINPPIIKKFMFIKRAI